MTFVPYEYYREDASSSTLLATSTLSHTDIPTVALSFGIESTDNMGRSNTSDAWILPTIISVSGVILLIGIIFTLWMCRRRVRGVGERVRRRSFLTNPTRRPSVRPAPTLRIPRPGQPMTTVTASSLPTHGGHHRSQQTWLWGTPPIEGSSSLSSSSPSSSSSSSSASLSSSSSSLPPVATDRPYQHSQSVSAYVSVETSETSESSASRDD